MFVSWVMILCVHNSIPVLYIARFIQGFTCGIVTVAYSLCCDEIAEVRVRGAVRVNLHLMLTVGMVLVYFVGAIVSHMWMIIACTILPGLFAVTFYMMPE
jgi:SP family facilitated glucose transporter-like MFS transporter 8